jgi:pimeloyl-ACP methyl ester carboxylesterase
MADTYATLQAKTLQAPSGIGYDYRDLGEGAQPLVLLQHFRGSLDNWDPALIDVLATNRRVIPFDNVGVAATTGITPSSIEEMARGALDFIDAMGLDDFDLLGFSIGSFVAQEIALARPTQVKRMILASAAPKGASGMHGWAADVIGAVGGREPSPEGYLDVFFAPSPTSRAAGGEVASRVFGRINNRDAPTNWETRVAQYEAVCRWGIPDHALLQRLDAIRMPVFVANGDSDRMILPRYSHLLAGHLPNAELKIYPDAAHGFLFQHHDEFARDIDAFLTEKGARS